MKNKIVATLLALTLLATALTGCTGPYPNKEMQKDTAGTTQAAETSAGETSATEASASKPADEKTASMTVGQLADYFINAADDYHTADRAAVLEGFSESEPATRLQMFVLASRAFGKLPAPQGNAKRIAPPPADLSDIPEWALEALQNLSNGGVLAASDLELAEKTEASLDAGAEHPIDSSGKSETVSPEQDQEENAKASSVDSSGEQEAQTGGQPPEEGTPLETESKNTMEAAVSGKDAQILAARFFALFGTNPKDDFFASVNKGELDALEIPEGESTAGGSSAVMANTDKQLKELILEIVNSKEEYPKGSARQKIRDLYLNFEDKEARDQAGLAPLKKYLDAVEAAGSFSELNTAIAQAVNDLGNFANGLFPGVAVTDTKDSSQKVLQLMTLTPGLSSEDYENPDGEAYQEYRSSIIKQLVTAGENQADAQRHADGLLEIEKELAEHMSGGDESGTIQVQTHYTQEKMDEMMPQAKPSELMTAIGVKGDTKMTVFDDEQFAAYAKWFTEENLELFKAMEKISLIGSYSAYLSTQYGKEYGERIPSGDIAVQNFLSEELGQLYVERYFPVKSKAEIEKMVNMMITTFKDRVKRLDWMEEDTKREALNKLDSLTVLIGYPDNWKLNDAEIKGKDEGGSYFYNVAASEVDKWKKQLEDLEKPTDPRRFPLAAYTVNAAAGRSTNTIIFPAGILQAPFYDKNASFEQNLGAIGSTIAHEITHMFDDGGAQFDAQGNVKNWWAEEDFAHFKDLCSKAEAFYEGREAAPGIPANGKETLSENISDIGGIACGLEILSKMENPDYDAFFRSYAGYWARAAGYDALAELAETDSHAPNNLRCNRVLANFREFYDTYEIREGDGMYVAPEDRIQIW